MSQRGAQPLPWRAKGLSDTLESSETFKGAMSALLNLIPDPTSADIWQCRPASVKKVNFVPTFPGAGVVSVQKVIGNIVFGLIASSTTPGFDQPFAFNLATNVFIALTGVTAANVPQTLPSTGEWTTPTMDLIGSKLIVTHPGFAATAFFFGWFDLSNPAAPTWNAGNLTGAITFALVPSAVAQFGGRAYFIVNTPAQPAVVFSDVLNATNVTAGTQVLTFGDNVALTAFGQLRLYNQAGGIIQSLIVFKGVANMYQITGDAALANLSINAMNVATGTLAPNSICATPKGMAFISPEGLRIVDFQATISDPIGFDGQGVAAPFIYSAVKSRMCAACNGNVIRISTQNANAAGSPFQEYWYDLTRKTWSGPHSFPAATIQVWANTFILSGVGIVGALWQSDAVQGVASVFIENGVQMTWQYQTPLLPDVDRMSNVAVSQSTLDMAFNASAPAVTVVAQDQDGAVFDTVALMATGSATLWGAFNWGQANWGSANNALAPRQLQWHKPLVFARLQFFALGQSGTGVKLGAWHFKYKILKYLTNIGAAA